MRPKLKHSCSPAAGEAGFSLVEVIVAVGVFALLCGVVLQTLAMGNRVLARSVAGDETENGLAVERFATQLREAAQTAIAVSSTAGLDAPGFGSVRLVLYVKDDAGSASYEAYSQSGSTVYRLDYGAAVPGTAAPAASSVVAGVTNIAATTIAADALAAQYGLTAIPHVVPLAAGASGAAIPVEAGNHVVSVTIGNAAVSQTIHVAAGVMPSGFTITGSPVVHAIVYRIDNPPECVRILGVCVGTRTTGNIYGRVSVSYDNSASWHVWCDAMMLHPNVYVGPNGFFTDSAKDGGYDPNDPLEKTAALVDQCRSQTPVFPDPNATDPPQRLATAAPIVYDTPPPAGSISSCQPGAVTPTCIDPSPQPTPSPAAFVFPFQRSRRRRIRCCKR